MIVRELLAKFGVQVDGSSFAKAQGALAGLHLALGGLKDIIKPVYDGLRDIVEGTAHAAREAAIAAQQTGLTTQEVQGLGYAATQTGLSAEELQHGLIHLARAAQEARNGSAEANLGFAQLGVRAVDAAGNVRPMAALLADVSAKFQAMPDGPKKAALAMQLFSRAGAQLIPLLNKGPAGMAALSAEAGKLGIVMSDKLIAAGAHYAATLERMKASAEGLKYSIASRLFPAFERSTQALSAWIAKNREWISLDISRAFEYATRVVHAFVDTGKDVVSLFTMIWQSGGLAKTVLIGIGSYAALAFAPLASLAGLISLIVQDLRAPDSVIKEFFGAFKKMWSNFGSKEWELFKKDPLGKLYEWAGNFVDWLAGAFAAALNSVPGRMAQKATGIDPDGPSFMDFIASLIPQEGENREQLLDRLYAPNRSAYVGAPWDKRGTVDGDLVFSHPGQTAGGSTINVTVNAPGGHPEHVKNAVKQGLLEAGVVTQDDLKAAHDQHNK